MGFVNRSIHRFGKWTSEFCSVCFCLLKVSNRLSQLNAPCAPTPPFPRPICMYIKYFLQWINQSKQSLINMNSYELDIIAMYRMKSLVVLSSFKLDLLSGCHSFYDKDWYRTESIFSIEICLVKCQYFIMHIDCLGRISSNNRKNDELKATPSIFFAISAPEKETLVDSMLIGSKIKPSQSRYHGILVWIIRHS